MNESSKNVAVSCFLFYYDDGKEKKKLMSKCVAACKHKSREEESKNKEKKKRTPFSCSILVQISSKLCLITTKDWIAISLIHSFQGREKEKP